MGVSTVGLLRRLIGTDAAAPAQRPPQRGNDDAGEQEDPSRPDSWYAPRDGDARRFIGADGMPCLRLIPYRDSAGEDVLRLCEDTTGLLVGPTDPRLTTAGVLVSQLRGEAYHDAACRAGDFRPGARVRLVPELDNPYDDRAVAVYAENGRAVAAYMNKQKARAYLKRVAAGETLEAISIRGTRAGRACEQIAVLAATPQVIAHLLSSRPVGAPKAAHERR
jgi:hypothetical protein